MLNFKYDIPTKVFFGEGQIKVLGRELKKYGKKGAFSLWWWKH